MPNFKQKQQKIENEKKLALKSKNKKVKGSNIYS